jgi:hypothetical protein
MQNLPCGPYALSQVDLTGSTCRSKAEPVAKSGDRDRREEQHHRHTLLRLK